MKRHLHEASRSGQASRLRKLQLWLLSTSLWSVNAVLLLLLQFNEIRAEWTVNLQQWLIFFVSLEWSALFFMPLLLSCCLMVMQKINSNAFTVVGLVLLSLMTLSAETLVSVYSLLFNQPLLAELVNAKLTAFSDTLSWYLKQSYMFADMQKYLICITAFGAVYWCDNAKHCAAGHKKLAKQLRTSELAMYRVQLNPHFLFNSLNSLSALVRTRRKTQALEAIGELSQLLRSMIDNRIQELTDLNSELNMVSHYIHLQKLRFGERLHFQQDISREALKAKVPVMLLVPLIENAIKYGSRRLCEIKLLALVNDQMLIIRLSNTIDEQQAQPGFGIGLSNNRARIALLYKEKFRFEQTRQGCEFVVEIDLPV